jgi:hypothetical protein
LAGAGTEGAAALEVGEVEGSVAIATEKGANDGKQGWVLLNGDLLPVAEGIATRCEVAPQHFDFANVWIHN